MQLIGSTRRSVDSTYKSLRENGIVLPSSKVSCGLKSFTNGPLTARRILTSLSQNGRLAFTESCSVRATVTAMIHPHLSQRVWLSPTNDAYPFPSMCIGPLRPLRSRTGKSGSALNARLLGQIENPPILKCSARLMISSGIAGIEQAPMGMSFAFAASSI